jgi:hypothetical protein
MNDVSGDKSVEISTPGGQQILLNDRSAGIEIRDAYGSRVSLEAGKVIIENTGKVEIKTSQVVIDAGMLDINAGLARFSGVVQADTVIANSIVGSSYTPGPGNIW